ncbi:MAG: hypothetical protein KatS3mg022_2292 [Armatimonadota bacterium]|nr:MAG: hypothetical protein KatS3mg022_2292 [Armatimonadota bacterium]
MNRLMVTIVFLLAAGGIAIWKLATYDPVANQPAPDLSSLSTWEPTTVQIRGQLDADASPLERKQQYGRLFRSRYRAKSMAVNLRVDRNGIFYLECAATIPTWDKALIAHQAWAEIRELFGGSPRVLIYESYIGTVSRRVGEARANAQNSSIPEVVFDTGWHLRRKPQRTDYLGRLPGG